MGSHSPGIKRQIEAHQAGKTSRWLRPIFIDSATHGARDTPQKQHQNMDDSIVLEHVLGMTVYSNSALACDPDTGLVAYPAGCVLVLLDSVKNKQLGTLHTPRKSITAVSFSSDGRYVLTGESGLQPAVRVWDIKLMAEVAMLRGHSFGIRTAIFSPRMREIIVVGDAKDMMISVWSWPGKAMSFLNKFSDEIYAMDVSSDSQYFVTVGNKHIKFFYLETKRWTGGPGRGCPIPLTCRYGMLDNLKENCFYDVACGRGDNSYVFVITTSGILCQINCNRFLERWVNVNMTRSFCLSTDGNYVFVGGSHGLIRMFNAYSLKIVLTLPRPHCLGLDIAQMTTCSQWSQGEYKEKACSVTGVLSSSTAASVTQQKHNQYTDSTASYTCGDDMNRGESLKASSSKVKAAQQHPAAKALTFDPKHQTLTVVYEDHSVYMWVRRQNHSNEDGISFYKCYSSMYHRGSVWDLTTYPVVNLTQTGPSSDSQEDGEEGGALPPGTLLSVSADGTLRAWDVSADICQESILKRNFVSPQCLKIVYAEKSDTEHFKKACRFSFQRNKKLLEAGAAALKHRKLGFTVVAVCPGGMDIATGNRQGRVCIYDTNTMTITATMHAHEAELTALAYSDTDNYKVLASGSRDRMIHVMDASRGYQLLTTLDDHSSTITAINFTYISQYLIMASSSLDMSVLVRVYMGSEEFILNPVRAIVEKKSIIDFAIHPFSGTLAFACQDRFLRMYSIMTSSDHHTFRGCPSHGGQLVKVQFDPSGQYLLTACSLKTINLLQSATGTLLSTFSGHAESITSIRFSHNVKHIISAAVDGCIFLWRLPESVTYSVKREMAEMGRLTRGMVFKRSWKKSKLKPKRISSEPNFKDVREPKKGIESPREKIKSALKGHVNESKLSSPIHRSKYDQASDQGAQQRQNLCVDDTDNRINEMVPFQDNGAAPGGERTVLSTSSDIDKREIVLQKQHDCLHHQAHVERSERESKGCATKTSEVKMTGNSAKTVLRSDAWLSACCERRRIFKLEARSIKKILGMMKLVTDAMEKDLANCTLAASPRTGQTPQCFTSNVPSQPDVGTALTSDVFEINCETRSNPSPNKASSNIYGGSDFTKMDNCGGREMSFDMYPPAGLSMPCMKGESPAKQKNVCENMQQKLEGNFEIDYSLKPAGSYLVDFRSDVQSEQLNELLRNACSREGPPVKKQSVADKCSNAGMPKFLYKEDECGKKHAVILLNSCENGEDDIDNHNFFFGRADHLPCLKDVVQSNVKGVGTMNVVVSSEEINNIQGKDALLGEVALIPVGSRGIGRASSSEAQYSRAEIDNFRLKTIGVRRKQTCFAPLTEKDEGIACLNITNNESQALNSFSCCDAVIQDCTFGESADTPFPVIEMRFDNSYSGVCCDNPSLDLLNSQQLGSQSPPRRIDFIAHESPTCSMESEKRIIGYRLYASFPKYSLSDTQLFSKVASARKNYYRWQYASPTIVPFPFQSIETLGQINSNSDLKVDYEIDESEKDMCQDCRNIRTVSNNKNFNRNSTTLRKLNCMDQRPDMTDQYDSHNASETSTRQSITDSLISSRQGRKNDSKEFRRQFLDVEQESSLVRDVSREDCSKYSSNNLNSKEEADIMAKAASNSDCSGELASDGTDDSSNHSHAPENVRKYENETVTTVHELPTPFNRIITSSVPSRDDVPPDSSGKAAKDEQGVAACLSNITVDLNSIGVTKDRSKIPIFNINENRNSRCGYTCFFESPNQEESFTSKAALEVHEWGVAQVKDCIQLQIKLYTAAQDLCDSEG